jgi:hypothetical protein
MVEHTRRTTWWSLRVGQSDLGSLTKRQRIALKSP